MSKFGIPSFSQRQPQDQSRINSATSSIRERIWNYPTLFFPTIERLAARAVRLYQATKPVSIILLISILMVGVIGALNQIYVLAKTEPRQELTEGVLGIPDDLNPVYIPQFQVQKDIGELVFNSLFSVNRDGTIEGDLVGSWEYKENGKEIHIKLKEDIRWHDGVAFTSSDVQFTVDLFKSLKGQESYYDTVENVEVEVVSDFEIVFKLERASASFLETINWPVLPEHILKEIPINELESSDFGKNPVGTGPYILSRWRGDEVILEKNENYFGGRPNLDRIILKSLPTEKDLISALLTGKIDSTAEITSATVSDIQGEDWIAIENIPLIKRYWATYFNFEGPDYLKDKRLRQALSSAINRSKIVKNALNEFASEAKGPIPESSWAYNSEITRYTFNLEKAKELLDEVGYTIAQGEEFLKKDGQVLEISLAYVSNPIQDDVAESIKTDWESIGVKVNMVGLDYKTFRDTLLIPRSFDIILFGVETLLDPDHFRLWHSSQISPPGRNFASYKSGYALLEGLNRVDELLDRGRITLDQEQRKDTYKRFQTYLLDEVPAAFLYHPSFIYVYNHRLKNVDISQVTTPEERFKSVTEWRIE